MSTEMMIALLGNAKNGADILSILDSFTAEDSNDEYENSTLHSKEFL